MKKLLLIYLLIPFLGICQDVKLPTDSTGKVIYSGVVSLDSNLSSNELFKRAKAWFVKEYNSSKDVIQDADQETHSITGKALMTAHMTVMGSTSDWGHVKYTVSISCKDGRYRYSISDFYHEIGSYPGLGTIDNNSKSSNVGYREKDYKRVVNEVNDYSNALVSSIKDFMSKKLSSASNDW